MSGVIAFLTALLGAMAVGIKWWTSRAKRSEREELLREINSQKDELHKAMSRGDYNDVSALVDSLLDDVGVLLDEEERNPSKGQQSDS